MARLITVILAFLLLSCNVRQADSAVVAAPDAAAASSRIVTNTELQDGDLIFQHSLSSQSPAIRIATESDYSHMGIIYRRNGQFFVYEAIQPVSLTPLAEWIDRGKDDAYTVRRLRNSEEVLTPGAVAAMKKAGEKYLGKDYDLQFAWSDDRIYCSELVWKIYQEALGIEIGQLQRLGDFDLSDPVVRAKLRERYGDDIPLDEVVITPESMFRSEKLVTVPLNGERDRD